MVFGQVSGVILTTHETVSDMIWSKIDNEFIFFEKKPRRRANCRWTIEIDNRNIGYIQMEELDSDDYYRFNIYSMELIKLEQGDGVMFKGIQANGGQKTEVIISKNERGEQMIAVFMAEDQLAVYFDNF